MKVIGMEPVAVAMRRCNEALSATDGGQGRSTGAALCDAVAVHTGMSADLLNGLFAARAESALQETGRHSLGQLVYAASLACFLTGWFAAEESARGGRAVELGSTVTAATKTGARVSGEVAGLETRWRERLGEPAVELRVCELRILEVLEPGDQPRPGLRPGALVHVDVDAIEAS